MPLTNGTPRWQKVATFVLLAAILVLAWFIFTRVGTTNAAVSATRDSVERTDCARQVNAEQSKARDRATIADRAATRFFDGVLLDQVSNGPPDAQTQQDRIATFGKLLATADAADKAVADLPDPAVEVERRCPG